VPPRWLKNSSVSDDPTPLCLRKVAIMSSIVYRLVAAL
jgi:hypothetical protein